MPQTSKATSTAAIVPITPGTTPKTPFSVHVSYENKYTQFSILVPIAKEHSGTSIDSKIPFSVHEISPPFLPYPRQMQKPAESKVDHKRHSQYISSMHSTCQSSKYYIPASALSQQSTTTVCPSIKLFTLLLSIRTWIVAHLTSGFNACTAIFIASTLRVCTVSVLYATYTIP